MVKLKKNTKAWPLSLAGKLLIPLFLILGLTLGCSKKPKVEIPEGIISIDTMSMVLADMHVVEGIHYKDQLRKKEEYKTGLYYSMIFNQYNITKERFEKSYAFYASNHQLHKYLYSETLDKLNQFEAELKTQDTVQTKKSGKPITFSKDSIQSE